MATTLDELISENYKGNTGITSAGEQTSVIDDILNSPSSKPTPVSPAPVNTPVVTPQVTATNKTATPTIKKTTTSPIVAAPIVRPQAEDQATLWNPTTGQKMVVKIGSPMPAGYKLWTGGTASGADAMAANAKNQTSGDIASEQFSNVAQTPFEADTGIEGYDEYVSKDTPTTDKWAVPSFDEIMEGMGITKLTTKDYSGDYKSLEDNYTSQLESIDLQFQAAYDNQIKKNTQISSSLKAKLIKAGVSMDGTSFESALAGQETRNSDELRKLENARDQAKAAALQNKTVNYLNISKQERDDYFNVQSENINNTLQGYNTSVNVWQAFNSRSNQEKTLEQDAKQHLDQMNMDWYKLDQTERLNQMNQIQDYIGKGLYDVYDENVVKMLNSIEKNNGLEINSLVNPATGGYWDRMSNIALKDAQAASMEANTNKTNTLLPLEVQKYQADIANIQSTISKRLSDDKKTGSQEANSMLEGSSAKLLAEAKGSDGYYDSSKYVKVMNEFIQEVDPKMTNEKYYQDLFMNYLPPTKLLNPSEDDKAAVKLRSDFTKSLKIEDLFGM